LVSQILDLLPPQPGGTGAGQPPMTRGGAAGIVPPVMTDQLTQSETRVLRYLPTHFTMHEIANELFLSVNTVNTHRRHVYAKLGAHTRNEAVDRARTLGLLAPSGHSRLRTELRHLRSVVAVPGAAS
jgi:LuxR family transcriptional regulator, maltose regulon positive regulatory protein